VHALHAKIWRSAQRFNARRVPCLHAACLQFTRAFDAVACTLHAVVAFNSLPSVATPQEVDVIAPLARGQAMLLAGPQRSQQSRAMLAMLGNQAGSEVRVIYASTGQSPEVLDGFVQQLLDAGVMPQCTVVAAPADASLGAQYAALCAALTLGEDIRNRGQHAFVALDSMESAVRLWDCATQNATAISQQGELPRLHRMLRDIIMLLAA
jgi:hypothetical protein